MSQIGGNVVGSLVVDISAPPEKAVAGLRVVEAETQRVAASASAAGANAGNAFGLGFGRSLKKSTEYINKAIGGFFAAAGVATAAYQFGKSIGEAIFNGVDESLKRLEDRLSGLDKRVDKYRESTDESIAQLLRNSGLSVTVEDISNLRSEQRRIMGEITDKTAQMNSAMVPRVSGPGGMPQADISTANRLSTEISALRSNLAELTATMDRNISRAKEQQESEEFQKRLEQQSKILDAELQAKRKADQEYLDKQRRLYEMQLDHSRTLAKEEAERRRKDFEMLQQNLSKLDDALREATLRMRSFTNSQLDNIASDVSNLAAVLQLRQPTR